MVSNRYSATISVDEDSISQIQPIDELCNDRSWAKNDNISAVTENDELQNEMKMLSFAELQLSQEIAHSERLFSNLSGNQTKRKMEENCRKRFNSATPAMNNIDIKSKLQESKLFDELLIPRNEERIDSISTKHEGDSVITTDDTRESPRRSQSFDEECTGIFGISTREPTEEIIFVDDGESCEHGDPAIVDGDVIREICTHFRKHERAYANEEGKYTNGHQVLTQSTSINKKGQEEGYFGFSESDHRLGQRSDIEKGGDDFFEEDEFWKDAFWKTSLIEYAHAKASKLVQQGVSSERKKFLHISQPRQTMIEKLSLPTLYHQNGKKEDYDTWDENHTFVLRQMVLEKKTDAMVESDTDRDMKNPREPLSTRLLTSAQNLPHIRENRSKNFVEAHVTPFTIGRNKSIEGDDMVTLKKEASAQRTSLCSCRMIILTIEVFLSVIGGIILWLFLGSKDSQN
mmetsp:Transcript_17169/g.39659  ORF Transcript_17169/g.39659 Transcript_17169/m.39659 type:complete len:459 (+) Transcript_17169:156-1532(+)